MPYFVFKVLPEEKLELVDTHTAFREAKTQCRNMRTDLSADANLDVRMIFAKDVDEGRRLLRTHRPPPPLEEWEA
ncbi:MAG: decarboxylase [Gammaproteobacteria bacterium]|nr:decarboxylase [Gammaproteobacteria bacterium]